MKPKNQTPNKESSVNLVSGLLLGTVVAAGATFLYKTSKGKKVRRKLKQHYREGKGHLLELIEAIKQQAESALEPEPDNTELTQAKQRLAKKAPVKKKPKKKTFLKAGRPLVK